MLQFIEGDWLGDSYIEMENVSNPSTTIVSNAKSTHEDFGVSNINRFTFRRLNISSFRNNFNFLWTNQKVYWYGYVIRIKAGR